MLSDSGGSLESWRILSHDMIASYSLRVAFDLLYSLSTHCSFQYMTELNCFTCVTAYNLSVYASLWSLPSSLQDSIQRPCFGFVVDSCVKLLGAHCSSFILTKLNARQHLLLIFTFFLNQNR